MTGDIVRLSTFPDNTERFLCDPGYAYFRRTFTVLWTVMAAVSWGAGISILISVLQHIAASGIDSYLEAQFLPLFLSIFLPMFIFPGTVCAVLGNSDIGVGNKGVWLHLFASWYLLVPKQSFRNMKINEVQYMGLTRRPKPAEHSLAVHIPGLTFFHRFVGLAVGIGFTPVFLVTPDRDGYEVLLQKLKEISEASRR